MKNIILNVVLLIYVTQIANGQTSNWVFTGPSNFPTNISGQIHGIGRVCQLKFDPTNNNTLYACSASGGLWKSLNAGISWTQLGTDQLPIMGTSSVCIDFTDPSIIYLSSGDPNYYNNDLGIWKTIDGGATWAQMNSGIGTNMAVEIVMDSSNHLSLIAATANGIWKTTDGGLNWVNKLSGNQFTDMKWKPEAGTSTLYASSKTKFFRSNDKGDTWTEITSGFAGLLASGTRIAVSASNPNIVYVGSVKDEGTIFKSIDSGLNFNIQYHNPSWSLTGYDSTGGGQGNYNFCLEANPDNSNQLFLGSHNIMRSNDGGLTWQKLTNWWQTVHTDMHDYVFQPGNSTNLFQANDGGVWLSSNEGVAWSQKSDGLGATENYHAAASPLYPSLISTGTQDNGELVHIDGLWKTNRGGDWTTKMDMDYSTQKFVYYYTDLERRALPSGSGDAYNLPIPITTSNLRTAYSPDDQNLAYVGGGGIWQTRNFGQSSPIWTQIVSSTATIRGMAVCKSHPSIFAYCQGSNLYISHNALSAAPSFNSYPLTFSLTNAEIVISSKDTNLVFIMSNQSVYKSIDGGQNFVNYTGTLPAINHMKLFIDDYSGNDGLYLGNTFGVYYRNNTMPDWINYSGALPTIASIKDIMYFNDGGVDARVYVSYYGRGTWETSLEKSNVCIAPSISTTTVLSSGVMVTWNNTSATQYDIQYREIGSLNWQVLSSNTNTAAISNYSGCTKYEVRVRSRCAADSSLWSSRAIFDTQTNPLNNDFDNHMDIGAVGAPGSVCYDAQNQRYTIYASGNDIWDKNDQFHFLYKKMNGDLSISARVKHIGNIYGWAKGGVMIRETLNTDSKHTMCALTPGNGFANQWRTNTNDWSDNVDTNGKEPGWVKLERIGNTFTSYFSLDGQLWNQLNVATISMTDTVYVGLANCSHIDSTINDAVFDNIIINGVALSSSFNQEMSQPFVISPNPAHEELTITMQETNNRSDQTIQVFDMNGNKKMEKKFGKKMASEKLNISGLISGIYFLVLQNEHKYITTFIKQ